MDKREKLFLLALTLIIGPLIVVFAYVVNFLLGYFFGVALSLLGIIILVLANSENLAPVRRWIRANRFKLLIATGLAISMFMYVSTIWLEDFVCNPKTVNIGDWIKANASFIFAFNDNPPLLDALLFTGAILAFVGTFLFYREKRGNIYALQKTLLIYSLFIAAMVFITVDVTKWLSTTFWNVNVASNGFPSWNYGFPTWTYQVTTLTAFLKYPDYSKDNPNAYFLNYWQLFTICIIIAVITGLLIRRQETKQNLKPR